MLDIKKILNRSTPTREALDATDPRRRAFLALAIFGAAVTTATWWWAKNGATLLRECAYRLETLQVYWTLVATPGEKKAWLWIGIAILLILVLALVLIHRFVWRALFPDLVRLDPKGHPGGRPERVGRLYRTRAFTDNERLRYRHYYKHGNRWLPLLRFDHVDLDAPAKHVQHGVCLITCGRLDRDPTGNRFRRHPATETFGAAPLSSRFREKEVVEDQDRKSSIVMPGPGMNPDVMRRKWQQESLQTRWAAEMEDDDIDQDLEEALARARTQQ